MDLKEKCVAVAKTTKMALKGNGGVEKNVHYRGVQKRDSGKYSAKMKDPWKKSRVWLATVDTAKNFAFPAPPVNLPPRQNSCVQSANAMLAVESPLPLDLSFGRSYSSSSVGLSTNGIGGGGGATVPITGASSVIDFMDSVNRKHIDIDLNYPPAPGDM
ncbi:hypothetical protein R3W88_031765 [Solanum pinnatisectum]|uniref:AP2/ERF domain-containing protein n=1 Tax=Solanum pinnatisectum TaxID=50273 RepID=A0AAV9LML6_9SOLN|nr:hypothetical protein R3W88_031765 [Solanum pinnatisectum]